MKMALWTKEQTLILINEYKKEQVLYNVKNPFYHNKVYRKKALEKIRKGLREVRPETTAIDIKLKINTLRTQFNRELNAMRSKHNESGHISCNLWCFNSLLFLKEHVLLKYPNNVVDRDSIIEVATNLEDNFDEAESKQMSIKNEEQICDNDYDPNDDRRFSNSMDETNRSSLQTTIEMDDDRSFNSYQPIERSQEMSSSNYTSVQNDIYTSRRKGDEDSSYFSLTTPVSRNSHSDDTAMMVEDEWNQFGKFIISEIRLLKNKKNKSKLKREILCSLMKYQELEEKDDEAD